MELTSQGGGAAQEFTHDRLVQMQVPNKLSASEITGLLGSKPQYGGDIPIVLIPEPRNFFSFGVQVASGPISLMQVAGKDNKIAPTGYQPWFFTSRIAYIVTQQTIYYNCPVKECPTKDDVMINVDVVVAFRIVDARTFVYKMGAARADILLNGAVEELMRTLIRNETHDNVLRMRGAAANAKIPELNKKFEEAGLLFSRIDITTIRLPKDIEISLQTIINQQRTLEKIDLDHSNNVPKWRALGDQQVQAIESKNSTQEVDENNKKAVIKEELNRVTSAIEEEANAALAMAAEQVNTMRAQASGDLRRAKDLAEANRKRDLNDAQNEVQAIRLRARDLYTQGIKDSLEHLAQSKREAQAIRRDAEVEMNLEQQVALKRQHEIALAQRRVLAELAEKGEYNLIGPAGDDMLKSLLGGEFGSLAS